ncbi:MAG TPA: DUF819 family protein [Bacteroidales bacterium]|nr:DUF819 family protein [Bacteroidales bacterium]HQO06961.1 DUF819 family protein [Bacteroidales bacterium]HQP52834.1 DUF819 family protein [Bacteroidales bacterium]
MDIFLLLLFFVFSPLGILYLIWRFPLAAKIGSVLIAYLIGLILGNSGLLTEDHKWLQDLLTTVTIPIALPLLLFSMNIKVWINGIGNTVKSMILGIISLLIPVVGGYFLLGDKIDESWKIAGMLTGVYTGGTPNLAAIKLALNVRDEVYILSHTYDMLLSAFFLLFAMSVAQQVLLLWLKPYEYSNNNIGFQIDNSSSKDKKPFFYFTRKSVLVPLLIAIGLAVLIFAIGGGLSMLVPENSSMAVAILSITTLGIAASFIPKINKTEKTFDAGMYLILIFSVVVASMADFRNLNINAVHLFLYITLCVFGSFIIHIILAKIFNVDADNVIVVSTALTCSPPFVPVVASALKNKEIILSGITVGIIGYAIGNYLGISIAWALHSFKF